MLVTHTGWSVQRSTRLPFPPGPTCDLVMPPCDVEFTVLSQGGGLQSCFSIQNFTSYFNGLGPNLVKALNPLETIPTGWVENMLFNKFASENYISSPSLSRIPTQPLISPQWTSHTSPQPQGQLDFRMDFNTANHYWMAGWFEHGSAAEIHL